MCSCQQLSGKLNTFHTCVILAMRCAVLLSTVLSLTLCNYICTWLVSVPSADVVFIIELMCSLTKNSIMLICCGTLHPNSYPKNGCMWAGKPTLSLRNASQQTKPPFVFVHIVFCKAANSNETTPFALKSTVFLPAKLQQMLASFLFLCTSDFGDLPTLINNGQVWWPFSLL